MRLPGRLDLSVYRGDTFDITLHFQNDLGVAIDLTGNTYIAQIRPAVDAALSTSFTVDTSDAATGDLLLTLTAVQTAALTKDGVWDIQETDSGEVHTLIAGLVTLVKDVSRA